MAFGRITLNEQITPSKWPSLRSSTKKARQKADPASLMLSGFPKPVTMAIRRCFVCSSARKGRIAVPASNRLMLKSRRLIRFDLHWRSKSPICPIRFPGPITDLHPRTSRFRKVREGGELRPLYVRSSTPEWPLSARSARWRMPQRRSFNWTNSSRSVLTAGTGLHAPLRSLVAITGDGV